MPYIDNKTGRREELRKGDIAKTPGELNFLIFAHFKYDKFDIELVKKYVKDFLGEKPNYQKYNDMTGAIARCYVEIERRLNISPDELIEILVDYDLDIAVYEDEKIKENGDV